MNFLKFSTFLTVILMCIFLHQTEARYNDLAAKLAKALSDPENSEKFNEIISKEENSSVDPIIFLYMPDDEATEQSATDDSNVRSENKDDSQANHETSAVNVETENEEHDGRVAALRRSVRNFFGTLLQIRSLFHLHN